MFTAVKILVREVGLSKNWGGPVLLRQWFVPKRLVHSALLAAVSLLLSCSLEAPRRDAVSGTIETDESRIASRYGGRVEAVLAREGDELEPGQLIARLSAPELLPRRQQLQALLAELEAGPRKEEILAARNDWEALLAELEFARTDAKRLGGLFQQSAVPEAERDRSASRVAALEKSVAAAKSRYDLLMAGTRPERIAQAQAQLAELETQIKELEITAPTNAVLEVLHVKVGDVLTAQRDVATLLLADHLWVRVFVPEPWLGHIQLGQKVRVLVDSFPGKEFAGEVEQIGRAAEFTPRNVQTVGERVKQVFGIKIRLPHSTGQLRAGMAADVFFPSIPAELKR